MYSSDRTFDVIMAEMMETFGRDIRTDEGSLAYNACAKIAEKLEEIYGDLDEVNDNMLPDTQDDWHLIEYGKERGIEYHYATNTVVKAVFKQEIEIGERFSCGDYTYEVTELIDGYTYKMACETEGAEANATIGQLEPIEYVDEYQGGEITEILEKGTDDEDIESFRGKVISTFKTTSFCGNKADYRRYIDQLDGVGGCKPLRRQADSPQIVVYIIGEDFLVPDEEVVKKVQEKVDPEESHGEGDGMAPICHTVQIHGVMAGAVDIETKITFDDGYSAETSKIQIEKSVELYLDELRQGWEEREQTDTIVRLSQIEARILQTEGILDVAETKLNGKTENILLSYEKIPTLGVITVV